MIYIQDCIKTLWNRFSDLWLDLFGQLRFVSRISNLKSQILYFDSRIKCLGFRSDVKYSQIDAILSTKLFHETSLNTYIRLEFFINTHCTVNLALPNSYELCFSPTLVYYWFWKMSLHFFNWNLLMLFSLKNLNILKIKYISWILQTTLHSRHLIICWMLLHLDKKIG